MTAHLVVVGASLAGLRGIESARRHGFTGRITLVGDEPHLPYDRPPLSKEYIGDEAPSAVPLLSGAHELASGLGVELRLGRPATWLDVDAHTLEIGGDEQLSYDRLVIATGATPRTLAGTDQLQGVHVLRTIDDADAVRKALDTGARTVVIGAGFIGSEVASAARKRGAQATVLEALPTPLVRSVGAAAGAALSALHERNGTRLRCGVVVEGLEAHDGAVSGVRLADGEVVAADLVVVGIGVVPATGWLEGSGLVLENGIVTDENLQASTDVWAAGDVARWTSPDFGIPLRLEHWTNAAEMGAHAVRNALEKDDQLPYSHIPYFWSDWYGHRIQFAGIPVGEPLLVGGAWDSDSFTALYREGDRFVGVLTLNRRSDIMKYRALIARRAPWDEALAFAAARNAVAVG